MRVEKKLEDLSKNCNHRRHDDNGNVDALQVVLLHSAVVILFFLSGRGGGCDGHIKYRHTCVIRLHTERERKKTAHGVTG